MLSDSFPASILSFSNLPASSLFPGALILQLSLSLCLLLSSHHSATVSDVFVIFRWSFTLAVLETIAETTQEILEN